MKPEDLFKQLAACEIDFYSGVPDSLLQNFCSHLHNNLSDKNHLIAANEGGAVALAIGHHLATGKIPVVYLQNSGLGNTINPLTSLVDPLIFGIPMLLMIGWRGEINVAGEQLADEPQHRKQGRITPAMLDCLGIPWETLSAADDPAKVKPLLELAVRRQGAVAILVRKGCFAKQEVCQVSSPEYPLSRRQAIAITLNSLPASTAYVATTGMIGRQLHDLREERGESHDSDLLCVGGMGHAIQISAGIANSYFAPVCCLDGDGAILMHSGNLAISGNHQNLLHLVLNNGVHASVGGQPTRGFDCDFVQLARAFGYHQAVRLTTATELQNFLSSWQQDGGKKGSTMLELRINKNVESLPGRPLHTPRQNHEAFSRFLLQGGKDE